MQASDDSRRYASPAALPSGHLSAPTRALRRHALRWGQAVAGGLVLCLALSACGGDDDHTGSDGKAREVRCAR